MIELGGALTVCFFSYVFLPFAIDPLRVNVFAFCTVNNKQRRRLLGLYAFPINAKLLLLTVVVFGGGPIRILVNTLGA